MPSGIVGYNWWLNGVKVNDVLIPEPGTFTFDGLNSNANFNVTYTVVDAAGNESAPSPVLPTKTLTVPSPDDPLPVEDRNAIDAIVAQDLAANLAPGIMVHVSGPKGTYKKAYGSAGARPLTTDDHFRMGSITKTFTAVMIFREIDKGTLFLDSTLEGLIPGVPAGDQITIAHMLSMRSGIYDYTADIGQTIVLTPTAAYTADNAITSIKGHPSGFVPGTAFQYTNGNYILLGRIVELLNSGRTIAQMVIEDLVGTLGLTETAWPPTGYPPAPFASGIGIRVTNLIQLILAAFGSLSYGDATAWNPEMAGAAGALTTTIGDLHRWGEIMRDNDGLMSSESYGMWMDTFFVPQPNFLIAGVTSPAVYDYGLGMVRMGSWLGHDGSVPGYETNCMFDPDTGAVIAVMGSKQSNGHLDIVSRTFLRIAGYLYPDSVLDRPPGLTIRPATALAVAAGFAPVVTLGGNKTISPAPALAVATGGGSIGRIIQPAAASATATGFAPTVTIAPSFEPFDEQNLNRTNEPVPDGATACYVTLLGAGGGGGSGRRGATNSVRRGGAGGGGGAKVFRVRIPVENLGSTYSTTCGLPGEGGTPLTGTAAGNGSAGTAGDLSQFTSGSINMTANGGAGGAGGPNVGNPPPDGGPGGTASVSGISATTANGTSGGKAWLSNTSRDAPDNTTGGAAGGGAGGGISSSNTRFGGGKGGDTTTGTGGAGGGVDFAEDGPDQLPGDPGPGGGGGYAGNNRGHPGGDWGGGGGGSGGSTTGSSIQGGGVGGSGLTLIEWVND